MRRLYLVRHAPTHAKTMVGWTDVAADCSDERTFARLSAHLPAEAALVSSDLSRAVATADRLAPRRRLAHHRGLRELNFGAWEMRSFAEIEAKDGERLHAFWDRPGEVCPPGGESWNALCERVETALEALLAAVPGDLVVVSHFGPIVAAIQRADRLSSQEALGHRIANLSVTEIDATTQDWRLIEANRRL